eukprot:14497263-Ditylum_brightwellii.AAC.1
MLFAQPAMLIVVSREVLEACMQRPRRQRRHAAGMFFEVQSFYAQLTTNVLLHWKPMWQRRREVVISSKYRNPSTIPANSKLFMIIVPVGLLSVMNAVSSPCGKNSCHTTNSTEDVPGVQTPLAPSLHALVKLTNAGVPVTGWQTRVGCLEMWQIMPFQSCSACQ